MATKRFPNAPGTVYTSAVGTPFHRIDEQPSSGSAWKKLADKTRIGEDGIAIMRPLEKYRPRTGGSAGDVDGILTGVAQGARFMTVGLDDEALQKAFQLDVPEVITPDTDVPGQRIYAFYREIGQLPRYAVMIYFDGQSPIYQGGNIVVTFPVATIDADQEINQAKSDLAKLNFEIMAIEDDTATDPRRRFGDLIIQTAAAA